MNAWPIVVAAAAALAALVLTPWLGPGTLSLNRVLSGDPLERELLIGYRLSRTLLAMLAGGALSLTGCVFQALLRNSLADPYTLGVSGGAALGAVIAITLGLPFVWIGALAGSAVALGLVLGFALRQSGLSAHALVLAGMALNSACAALIMLLHSFAGVWQSVAITTWLIGGVDATPFGKLAWLAAVVLPVSAAVILRARAWNVLALGEAWAAARGVSVNRLLAGGYLSGSVLAAAIVSVTGPIGFAGLIVPHLARHFAGADHRVLMPCSFLYGAAFLATCDAIGRSLFSPLDVPVGVLTALLGGPGLIWMLRSQRSPGA